MRECANARMRESGIGNRESGIGNRESEPTPNPSQEGLGNRESGIGNGVNSVIHISP
ncbi:MAG: hypothetical protein F6K55_33490 [Moorea sp. SIO4A3]|nr:hypothetical protein [Moorena sp. SIO4A3]